MGSLVNNSLHRMNLFSTDPILFRLASSLPQNLLPSFEEVGLFAGSKEAQDLARLCNKTKPNLYLEDDYGNKFQSIEMHPAYHALLRRSKHIGLVSSLWEENNPNERGVSYQARAIRLFLMSQLESGHLDEIIQTNAGIAALINETELYQMLKQYLLNRQHDASEREISQKRSISFAIASEEGFSSNLGAKSYNYAKKISTNSDLLVNNYSLNAHNCLIANPQADVFFVMAEIGGALSCFLVPKYDMNGKLNNIKINILMNNTGYRSRPLSVVNFDNSICWMIGEVGEGKKIADAINIIRMFDQSIVAAGVMRAGLKFVLDYLRYNQSRRLEGGVSSFNRRIFADMALDIAGAQALIFRIAKAFDNSASDRGEAAYVRIITPVAYNWINKMVAPLISELISYTSLEHYTENTILSRALVDAPVRLLNTKSSNAIIQDIITMANRAPSVLQSIYETIASSNSKVGEKTIAVLSAATKLTLGDPGAGSFLLEQLAYAAASAALEDVKNPIVSNAFSETRLGGQWRTNYGTINMRHNASAIIESLYPTA